MENNTLFSDLKRENVDGTEIAINFINKDLSENEINIYLTNLLKDSCGINAQLSPEFVENENYDDIVEFFEEYDRSDDSSVELCNSNFYNRCIKFFEAVITYKTEYFSEDGQFHGYLFHLTGLLSDCTSLGLRVTCFAIQLKFVTGCIKRFQILEKNLPDNVFDFAIQILKKAVSHTAVQCQISALYELQRWIELNQTFAEDEYLRLVPWCLMLPQPKVVCISLKVAHKILSMTQLINKFTLFVTKLLEVFTDLIYVENLNIFENIVQCCKIICLHHRGLLSSSFLGLICDNLYVENRDKAKITAKFLVNSIFSDSAVDNIRFIIKFLSNSKEFFIELVVDAMIEVYDVFINWKLLARILMDQEQERLTLEEKENFLAILKCIIEEAIKGVPPEVRNKDEYQPDLDACALLKKNITKYFAPALKYLLDLIFLEDKRTKCVLLHIGRHLDFEALDADLMRLLIRVGYWIFEVAREPECINASLKFMCSVYTSNLSQSIIAECATFFDEWLPNCGTQFRKLIEDFLNNPEKYEHSEDRQNQDKARLILLRTQAVNWEYHFDREIGFDIPGVILKYHGFPDNPVFTLVERVCIYLMTENIIHVILNVEKSFEENAYGTTEFQPQLLEIGDTIELLTSKMRDNYSTDLGEIAFFAVCRILSTFKVDLIKDFIYGDMSSLVTYVILTTCEIRSISLEKSEIQKMTIIKKILELVLSDILLPPCVYDIFTHIGNCSDSVKHVINTFFLNLCKKKGDKFFSDWILEWIKGLHKSPHSRMTSVRQFVEIISSIKNQIRDVMYTVQIDGLNYSRNLESTSCSKFLELLSKLCVCLRETDKRKVGRYLNERKGELNSQFLDHYKDFLKESNIVASLATSPSTSSTDSSGYEEFFLPASPETSDGSASINYSSPNDGNADESDLVTSPSGSRVSGTNTVNTNDHEVEEFDFTRTGITSEESTTVDDVLQDMEQLLGRKSSTSSASSFRRNLGGRRT